MSTVISCTIVSLDGYTADADGNPLVLTMDEAFDAVNRERIEAASAIVLGRTSFEGFRSYWPAIADAPDRPGDRSVDDDNRRISRAWARTPKVVVSDTLARDGIGDGPWADSTTAVPRAGATEAIAELRAAAPNGEILMFASGMTRDGMLAQGLIDELHLVVSPVILGAGAPLATRPVALETLELRRLDGSPNLLLRMGVDRDAVPGEWSTMAP